MFKVIVNGFIDLVYPKRCLLCAARIDELLFENFLCRGCFAKIEKNKAPFCAKCGQSLTHTQFENGVCNKCRRKPFAFSRAWSACYYEGVLKDLIHRFKYEHNPKLARLLAQPLAGFIQEYKIPLEKFDCCIPMPLHPIRLREREFNQAQLLAEEIGGNFNLQILRGALSKIKNTRPQTDLKEKERFSNIKGAFAVQDETMIKGKTILLLDDLITTGATASEASATLINAGAKDVCVLTLATPR